MEDDIKNDKGHLERSKRVIDEFQLFKSEYYERTIQFEKSLKLINVNTNENLINVD